MKHATTPTRVRTDDVKTAARRVGLGHLQTYLDHLTRTRKFRLLGVVEADTDERWYLSQLFGEEDLDRFDRLQVGYRLVKPLRGPSLEEFMSKVDLAAQVRAKPFVKWHREELQRLRRDAQLLADAAAQRELVAAELLERAQARYVSVQKESLNRQEADQQMPDWRLAQQRRAREVTTDEGFGEAEHWARGARVCRRLETDALSQIARLGKAEASDLAVLGAAIEWFICREFSSALPAVDSVEMLFLSWVEAESITCANEKCGTRFLLTRPSMGRPPKHCSNACTTAACRSRSAPGSKPIAALTADLH